MQTSFLPAAFVRNMAQLLEGEMEPFLLSYEQPPNRGIRFREGLEHTCPDAEGPVPWFPQGRYLKGESLAGAAPVHDAGAYYLQEPSAMAPAALLAPRPGERVLDLCAAPGGKSTQLGQLLQGRGVLVANEIEPGRAAVLAGNLERMGIRNSIAVNERPRRLAEAWGPWFDRVLVDAPCSGEGMFRRHPETAAEWHEKAPELCAARQLEILDCAAELLRPGGTLVYSTCTFNQTENEGVIARFLDRHPAFGRGQGRLSGIGGEEGMYRFWPHKVRGEGHFAAILEKEGAPGRETRPTPGLSLAVPKTLETLARGFLEEHVREELCGPVGLFKNTVVLLPEEMPPLKGIRILRLGLHIGSAKGSVFAPDHALALACESQRRLEISDREAEEWTTGQVLRCGEDLRGWVTPVCRGVALGWGKASGGMVKNHYPKGLRRRTGFLT